MDILELPMLVELAISDCEQTIKHNPLAVLSEGDFEKLLSEYISRRIGYVPENPTPNSFAVYTQISHYDNFSDDKDAQVDILLMKPDKIDKSVDKIKRFIYKSKESFAIELKYRHEDNHACVTAAKQDIDKFIKYKDDSFYYSIILLDINDKTNNNEKEIQDYYETKKKEFGVKYKNKFFCKVLKKE